MSRLVAVDANLLVSAHKREAVRHERALAAITQLTESPRRWAIPWPCVHEFLSVVTHSRVFAPPSTAAAAMRVLSDLGDLPNVIFLGESSEHLRILGELLQSSGVTGPKVHDARIAAICIGHGVDELWTADRDFSSFPALSTRNPLVG